MPVKARKICKHPGCKELVEGVYCDAHRPEPIPWQKKTGTRKENPYRQWYADPLWRKIRANQLAKWPLCEECLSVGVITPAKVVDHIIPHRGKWTVFTDTENLQSLCESCHNRKTARFDGGFGNKTKG